MDHALTICREQLVPAIYRGTRDVFGLVVGEPIPYATPDDVYPSLPSADRAPISIRIAPSATPELTLSDLLPSSEPLKRAIFTLLHCRVGGDVPEVRGVADPSSLRRAEKMLERHHVTLETLNTATLKGAAWLLGYATRNLSLIHI